MKDIESSDAAMLRAQGANILSARMRAGLSLQQVEDATNGTIGRQALSRWENGEAEPRAAAVVTLSRLYGCTPEILLMGAPTYDGSLFYSTAQEIADALGCGVNSVREALASGEMPSHEIFGRRRVYKRELVEWALGK